MLDPAALDSAVSAVLLLIVLVEVRRLQSRVEELAVTVAGLRARIDWIEHYVRGVARLCRDSINCERNSRRNNGGRPRT